MPDAHDSETATAEKVVRDVPVLWLLGKTGAGKSSLIRALTGLDRVEIGNGFTSCTQTSRRFDYPADEPLLSFLDTRGLGEAGYDPAGDLAFCEGHSHAVLIVARLDDQVQGEVAQALGRVTSGRRRVPLLVVHTGADLIPDAAARDRARATTQRRLEKAAGTELPSVILALPSDIIRTEASDPEGLEDLRDAIDQILPAAGLLLRREQGRGAEARAYEDIRHRVLYHAGIASASDTIPALGLVASTGVQVNMLRELGAHYGYPMTRAALKTFVAALGAGIGARFALGVGARQVGKVIPIFGQTAGAALASTLTFAATYAIGRAAAYYLFWTARGETPPPSRVREVFAAAMKRATPHDARANRAPSRATKARRAATQAIRARRAATRDGKTGDTSPDA
ncbi:YcjF family protein [Pseudooceanicola algae]|uniref:G domain-containing protein n=1 Tax=Pseudooceanicola algae TaxID=1537215 RepID=A0A418SHN1_9RHOB|nr:GTPase [Pseudooceanicola algae]QPM90297.1 hypothetical protein PSAL_015320 [Pseudooceanicola algae]